MALFQRELHFFPRGHPELPQSSRTLHPQEQNPRFERDMLAKGVGQIKESLAGGKSLRFGPRRVVPGHGHPHFAAATKVRQRGHSSRRDGRRHEAGNGIGASHGQRPG